MHATNALTEERCVYYGIIICLLNNNITLNRFVHIIICSNFDLVIKTQKFWKGIFEFVIRKEISKCFPYTRLFAIPEFALSEIVFFYDLKRTANRAIKMSSLYPIVRFILVGYCDNSNRYYRRLKIIFIVINSILIIITVTFIIIIFTQWKYFLYSVLRRNDYKC